jgi:hypothetical protein
MAKVIRLDQFRRAVRTPSGISFPTVYRVLGCGWHMVSNGDGSFRLGDPKPSEPYMGYSLSTEAPVLIANEKAEPITRLDAAIDQGWIIVRHHVRIELAYAYLDGVTDGDDDPTVGGGQRLWQTPDGFFTLHQRKVREGCRDHLLVYTMSEYKAVGNDWCHIAATDGTVFSDLDMLLPPRDED